jgi:hypothetical protein
MEMGSMSAGDSRAGGGVGLAGAMAGRLAVTGAMAGWLGGSVSRTAAGSALGATGWAGIKE